ncbi:hypothetical protein GY45DRAFT_1330611 [Cubamyces sp. BRFM 1775]|nr:hypothetical protein GY45DRAFT_1330611 [Cubamyces sp. BRFM 1775]
MALLRMPRYLSAIEEEQLPSWKELRQGGLTYVPMALEGLRLEGHRPLGWPLVLNYVDALVRRAEDSVCTRGSDTTLRQVLLTLERGYAFVPIQQALAHVALPLPEALWIKDIVQRDNKGRIVGVSMESIRRMLQPRGVADVCICPYAFGGHFMNIAGLGPETWPGAVEARPGYPLVKKTLGNHWLFADLVFEIAAQLVPWAVAESKNWREERPAVPWAPIRCYPNMWNIASSTPNPLGPAFDFDRIAIIAVRARLARIANPNTPQEKKVWEWLPQLIVSVH